MKNSFFSDEELKQIRFSCIGKNVLISRKASIYKPEMISIGDNVRIDDFCILSGGNGIEIGSHTHISCFTALYGGSGIKLGDFCNLSVRVTIFSEVDDISGNSLIGSLIPLHYKPGYIKGKVVLKNHSAVATNSTVLPGVELGEGVMVAAHSLVKENCEPWFIYFGVPAEKLRQRNKEMLNYEPAFLEDYKSRKSCL